MSAQAELFADGPGTGTRGDVALGAGARLLSGFAQAEGAALLREVDAIAAAAPFRRMAVPGGRRMSVAMTNCGPLGWMSDARGYRYAAVDPDAGRPWPPMPARFRRLAVAAAAAVGFAGFAPDACLVNRYAPGARMGLHRDRDEEDPGAPIVSVSLGLPATFLWGGAARAAPVRRLRLEHGDVVVWGGSSRFAFHGVAPLADGAHPLAGAFRYNLTFRRAALDRSARLDEGSAP